MIQDRGIPFLTRMERWNEGFISHQSEMPKGGSISHLICISTQFTSVVPGAFGLTLTMMIYLMMMVGEQVIATLMKTH